MFYTTAVTVKMLPLDNKSEFSLVLNMPDGTALPETANLASKLASRVLKYPEVIDVQVYVGTAKPFDFNGMVRHYYLRQDPWLAEIQIQLTDKGDRQRSSHEIAVAAREELTPLVSRAGGKMSVVEMPPGPPVLQSVVAEIYGPDMETRRQVAKDMTAIFQDSDIMVDVDNYLRDSHKIWRFEIDMVKANRQGITVDTINQNLLIAMGGMKVGDIKEKHVLEPTYIVIQLPYVKRSQIQRLGDLPIPNPMGQSVPLSELGKFTEYDQDELVFHKDLRAVEYVVGEASGRLGAPIYGMMDIDSKLQEYTSPDGQTLSGEYLGPPGSSKVSGFEWTGEWTVTFETFRDMGGAFMVALVAIYMLVVWQFGNFLVPAIIMAPIPLTLLGIIPGHWVMGAEFTATSMIGWIALAGIIVRNSILLVDFTIMEVSSGKPLLDSVINSCAARTRPIIITAFALVAGSSVILTDPIFQGMAISLLFGVLISTLLTLVVIPLGCISAGRAVFDESNGSSGGNGQAGDGQSDEMPEEKEPSAIQTFAEHFPKMVWVLVCAMATLMFQLVKSLLAIFFKGKIFLSLQNMILRILHIKASDKPDGGPSKQVIERVVTPEKSVQAQRVVNQPAVAVARKQATKKVSPQKKNVEFGPKRSKTLVQSFSWLMPKFLMSSSLR
jgi:multidrug efflux pump subunit AcrB